MILIIKVILEQLILKTNVTTVKVKLRRIFIYTIIVDTDGWFISQT